MNRKKTIALLATGFLLVVPAAAARSRPTQNGPCTEAAPCKPGATAPVRKPAATVKALSTRRPKPRAARRAGALATLNGRALTLLDLEPRAREAVAALDASLLKARRGVLDAEIDNMLLEAAARERKVTADELYNAEIAGRVTAPSEKQIKATYDANRERYGEFELWLVRDGIAGKLRDEQEEQLFAAWSAQQRQKAAVVIHPAASAAAPAPNAALATVNGRKITLASLSERLKPRLYQLRKEVYDAERAALERKVNRLLLEAEAGKRGVTPEDVLRAEITDKMRPPTEEEIKKNFEQNSWRYRDLPSARPKIVSQLESEEKSRLEKALYERLRGAARLAVHIKEPTPPVQDVSAAGSAFRGDPQAPVTVVEFGDFQCYPCARMRHVVEEALKPFGNSVRFVFRHYPLSMHPHAPKAAEAALAAEAQGKFWEYSELLFENQRALDPPALKRYAAQAGLDRTRFDAALDKGLYAGAVRRDMREGKIYGVDIIGTPVYFVNGVRLPLSDYNVAGLTKAVRDALARAGDRRQRAAK